ncbi:hypothetical protein [Paraburkholderia phenoliruptrix]|uniref:hypothetical protein n=1 Tax=Paraburkholderia phenoliruptrix TaxID=252970 RepID=UPI0034CFD028
MTPEQKLKHLILIRHAELGDEQPPANVTAENVDELYDAIEEPWDARNEVRCSGEETGLPTPLSRHYEADAVARQYIDGSWVGWTYWYGGGKHGEPEAIDWIEDAYDVKVTGEQTIVKRLFAKAA